MNKTDSKRGFTFNTERSVNREDLSFNPQALAEGTLVSKVALLSCVSAIFMAVGSYFGIGLENSPILVISCIVASFIGLFFLRALHSAPLAVLGLAVWNSLFGVTVGVGLQSYIATLGSHTVILPVRERWPLSGPLVPCPESISGPCKNFA